MFFCVPKNKKHKSVNSTQLTHLTSHLSTTTPNDELLLVLYLFDNDSGQEGEGGRGEDEALPPCAFAISEAFPSRSVA